MTTWAHLALAALLAGGPLAALGPVDGDAATVVPAVATAPHGAGRLEASAARCTVTSTHWQGVQRFWTADRTCYSSPWFAGSHRVMIWYGCNASPWYPKAKACRWKGGVHHGIDVDMPVGTPIRSAVAGRVLVRPRTMGRAYGSQRMLVRSNGRDHALGHLSRLAVRNGQWVRAGQLLGWSGMDGVEDDDGPHLHYEVRPAGRGYTRAVQPRTHLRLRAVR